MFLKSPIALQSSRLIGLLHAQTWQACGVDVSSHAVKQCRTSNLDAHVVSGHELPFDDQAFDVVTAWSVIEHVADIRQTLNEWKRVLRVGGVLAMDTSDASCLKRRLLGAKYRRFWRPDHTYVFSRTTLKRFVSQSGLRVLRAPFCGRLSDLSLAMATYALGYQLQFNVRYALRIQKAFQLFARREAAPPTCQSMAA